MRYYNIFQISVNIQEIQVLVIKITVALPVSSEGECCCHSQAEGKAEEMYFFFFSVMLLPSKEIKVKLNPS